MAEYPYLKANVDDTILSTKHLSTLEFGAYMRLCFYYSIDEDFLWESELQEISGIEDSTTWEFTKRILTPLFRQNQFHDRTEWIPWQMERIPSKDD